MLVYGKKEWGVVGTRKERKGLFHESVREKRRGRGGGG